MSKSFTFRRLIFGVILVQFVSPSLVSNKHRRKVCPCGRRNTHPFAAGDPRKIEAEKLADSETTEKPEDPCNSKERAKLAAYRVALNGGTDSDVLVRAVNFCYCGATGNCLFWVFHAAKGRYRLLLQAENVQDFGLLQAKTLGYRDLVVWSHDSAQRTPARLFQFNGKEYHVVCGWEENYEFKELPNGRWASAGDPKIVGSSCEQSPSSEDSKP